MSYGVNLHCWGDWACFTRPDMKVERVSYDVITPSAARGILEAIYWKPEIKWVVDRITVLKPIRFESIRRNEVSKKIPALTAANAMAAGSGNLGMSIEATRQQRASLVLKDVAYLIGAHFEMRSGLENVAKHLDQFNRRAHRGQCFTRPYLGCQEFAAHFALIDDGTEGPSPAGDHAGERDLGWMLHDIDFDHDNQALFFHATMRDGVIHVPVRHEAVP